MEEIWKDIDGYEGLYQVSNLGNVKSVKKDLILKPGNCRGYALVSLSKNGIVATPKIHRLVANAFIPNPDNLPCVNHKDENKFNNAVTNLELCTVKYNINYGTRTKRAVIKSAIGHGKPVLMIDKNGNVLREFYSIRCAERNFFNKKGNGNISSVLRGKTHTAYGYYLKYKNNTQKL